MGTESGIPDSTFVLDEVKCRVSRTPPFGKCPIKLDIIPKQKKVSFAKGKMLGTGRHPT